MVLTTTQRALARFTAFAVHFLASISTPWALASQSTKFALAFAGISRINDIGTLFANSHSVPFWDLLGGVIDEMRIS